MMPDRRSVIVMDTGALLQAALRPAGTAGRLLKVLNTEETDVFLSPRLRSEIELVLDYPDIRAKNPQLTDEQAEDLLRWADEFCVLVPNPPRYVEYPRDRKDEPVLNLAIHVEAEYIVTRDRDLLDLMNESDEAGVVFRRRFPRLTILDPVAFLNALEPPTVE